jgi:hypothetical protein
MTDDAGRRSKRTVWEAITAIAALFAMLIAGGTLVYNARARTSKELSSTTPAWPMRT